MSPKTVEDSRIHSRMKCFPCRNHDPGGPNVDVVSSNELKCSGHLRIAVECSATPISDSILCSFLPATGRLIGLWLTEKGFDRGYIVSMIDDYYPLVADELEEPKRKRRHGRLPLQ